MQSPATRDRNPDEIEAVFGGDRPETSAETLIVPIQSPVKLGENSGLITAPDPLAAGVPLLAETLEVTVGDLMQPLPILRRPRGHGVAAVNGLLNELFQNGVEESASLEGISAQATLGLFHRFDAI